MLNLKMIGGRISQKRKEKGMNQNELAEALFVTRQAVSKWEMGQSMPSIDILVKLTSILDMSIDQLLNHTDINEHAYQDLLDTYPRASIINRFMNEKHPQHKIKDIFYLLTPEERKHIIHQVLTQHIDIDIMSLWPYASVKERKYVITRLISNSNFEQLKTIYPFMTDEERLKVSFQHHPFTMIFHGKEKQKKEENEK